MPLLNYTTSIEVGKTVSEIVAMLACAGARSVSQQFTGNSCMGVSFVIDTEYGPQEFVLPVEIEPVFMALARERKLGKIAPRYVDRAHANRVGWRITKDWLAAQLALIEIGLATLDQVMLPYMLVDGRTVYHLLKEERLKQIPERAGVVA